MPRKKSKKKRKGKKMHNHFSPALVGKPFILLGTLSTGTTRERPPGEFWGGPVYSPELYSYRPPLDYQYPELDSAGSYYTYYPYEDYREGYGEYRRSEESYDVSPWSDSEVDCLWNSAMEVEEALHEDPPSVMDTWSADSESDKATAPKAMSEACCSRVSKMPSVTCREATSTTSEGTPSLKSHGPRAPVPTQNPQRGKKEVSPVPTPETGKMAGALPGTSARSRKSHSRHPN
ncbi:hypothetical protein P4O66_003359 [Electrophorus voltai]|uniref:Uncharacterized protein n=1 Tax=Electrophorus voltai TaxID=2609070 RepID=A0AAD8YRM7_9TELE|nr:hypothetical protein P4O66_003359 [Electrophorus voltai]